ncbi:eukaryotic translation initiation factor 3 subunit H-like [Electrophorus electricus]|uniref:eukaryotic translation initiation factor 3 subunit H-like n=1 Tax=Electrophorus electricus TaxID=8005 RepID=UPI000F0A3C98|nr:eukaryotic translation initiation factor 3 subunit H-like [Electrophorus electricus]
MMPTWTRFGHTVQYEMEMMKSLRHVNIDHLHVGWYLSTFYGSFVIQTLLDSQFSYQHAIEESVVLIYDPIKMAQGPLSLKAYRLTPKLMDICMVKDFSKEGYVNQPVLVQTRPTQLCTVTRVCAHHTGSALTSQCQTPVSSSGLISCPHSLNLCH